MRTWNDYKKHVKSVDYGSNVEEMEEMANIIGAIISKRSEMNISQSDLAKRTGLSQLTIAQIESFDVIPSLETISIIFQSLGL